MGCRILCRWVEVSRRCRPASPFPLPSFPPFPLRIADQVRFGLLTNCGLGD
jgi:hypothetical protein